MSQQCAHTLLYNYIIGLCKKEYGWPSTLADLGYDVKLIEQKMGPVKPDLVAVSRQQAHCLVCECKGGKTVDPKQLSAYSGLQHSDIFRYVEIQNQFGFDVCLSDMEECHADILKQSGNYPILTFGKREISKSRKFANVALESSFAEPINIENAKPPLLYYPFSANDDDLLIQQHVFRALAAIALKNSRGEPTVLYDTIIDSDEILTKIHKLWKVISQEHKNELKKKIERIIKRSMDSGMGEYLQAVEERHGYRIQGPLTNFLEKCQELSSSRALETFGQSESESPANAPSKEDNE